MESPCLESMGGILWISSASGGTKSTPLLEPMGNMQASGSRQKDQQRKIFATLSCCRAPGGVQQVVVRKIIQIDPDLTKQLFCVTMKAFLIIKYNTIPFKILKLNWHFCVFLRNSQFQKEYSLEEVLQSRKVFDFLTVLQCW